MKTFRHIILVLTALILASCAVDEFWDGSDYAEGEEVVMTFRPKFEDFEAVTKAIGDGSQVDQLLVHIYEEGSDQFEEKTYDITSCQVQQEVKIPFFYGKKYKVYFWAYKSGNDSPYTLLNSNIGLKGGVSVDYPANELGYDALESLDAFYAVSDVDLSNGRTMDINLTRPFAQVNLVADKTELKTAQASKVEFTINVAETFNLASQEVEGTTEEQTFTFTSEDNFQSTEEINGNVYLGTTYLFVPSSGKVIGKVKLYAGDNVLKSAENIEIPLVGNKRTNLVFSGFQISVPDWDSNKETVPGESNYWITITEPEQLAALLMTGTTENTQVRIGSTLNMEKMPQDVKNKIVGKSFSSLTLDGNGLTIKNFSAPAFFANAANLTVSNLTLENVNITAATHVGVLVNELKGNGTFTNVTIKGSSATTTNGAAGGFVGRSVRTSEKDRSETLALTFTDCRIEGSSDNNIVAKGSAAEGKFVGLFTGYDNGEKLVFTNCTSENAIVADYDSRYVEGNEGAWLAGNNYSAYNGFLGSETYFRGKVYFGGENESTNRFCAKWDGKTTVEPLLANPTYDGANAIAGTNKFAVYSPFDLAGVRKKTASPAAIYLKADIDLNGQGVDGRYNVPSNFTKSAHSSADDIVFDPFSYVTTLDGYRDASTNNSIYNMSIAQIEQERAAFILYASGTTVHKNINFRNCQTVTVHKPVSTDAKAYGAILVSNVDATYTMENVHAYDCKVFALQKIGTLGARISGISTLKNNSVNNCYVENYECNISERFTSGKKTISRWTVEVYADFYPNGEVGGMYGFIQGSSTLTNCKVNATTIYAFGQDDKMATVDGSLTAQFGIALLGYYKVPGRHVSTMIGNIRATGTVTLTGCSVDANTKCTNRHDKHNNTYNFIGQAYIVKFVDSEGSVTVDGKKLTLADCNKNTKR